MRLSLRTLVSWVHVNRPQDGAPLDARESRVRTLEWDLRGSLELDSGVYLEALLPLRYVVLDRATSTQKTLALGDSEVSIRTRLIEAPRLSVDLRAGLSLPFGDVGPAFVGDEEQLLLGSGTIDPILGVQASYQIGRDRLILYGWTRAPLINNAFEQRAGFKTTGGLGYRLRRSSFAIELSTGIYHQHRGSFPGRFHSLSAEHTDLFASGSVALFEMIELGLLLPLTIETQGAHSYHTTAALSLTLHHAI